jgi:hypothetical protein
MLKIKEIIQILQPILDEEKEYLFFTASPYDPVCYYYFFNFIII